MHFSLYLIVGAVLAMAPDVLANNRTRVDQDFFNGLQAQISVLVYSNENKAIIPRPNKLAEKRLPQFFQMLSSLIEIHEFQARNQHAIEGIGEVLDALKNDTQKVMKSLELVGKQTEYQTYSDMKQIEEYLKLFSTVEKSAAIMKEYKSRAWLKEVYDDATNEAQLTLNSVEAVKKSYVYK